MTRNEIKNYIMEQVAYVTERYNGKGATAAATHEHVTGQVLGMIKAFKMAGMLDPKDDLLTEILYEI